MPLKNTFLNILQVIVDSFTKLVIVLYIFVAVFFNSYEADAQTTVSEEMAKWSITNFPDIYADEPQGFVEEYINQRLIEEDNTEQFLVRYETLSIDFNFDGNEDTVVLYTMDTGIAQYQHTMVIAGYGPVSYIVYDSGTNSYPILPISFNKIVQYKGTVYLTHQGVEGREFTMILIAELIQDWITDNFDEATALEIIYGSLPSKFKNDH